MSRDNCKFIMDVINTTFVERKHHIIDFLHSKGVKDIKSETWSPPINLKFFNRHCYSLTTHGPFLFNGSMFIDFFGKANIWFYHLVHLFPQEVQERVAKHELAHYFHFAWRGPELYNDPEQLFHGSDFMDISEVITGERWNGIPEDKYLPDLNTIRIIKRHRFKLATPRAITGKSQALFFSERIA